MGSSNTESKTLVSSLEFEQETTIYPNLKMHPSPATETIDPHLTNKKLTTSSSNVSSSPDSPLDNPFHDDDKSSFSSSSSPDDKHGKTSSSKNSVPKPEPSKTEAPPVQVMEHSTSSYRIPSSVFARNKSKTPMEWSVASNDSLFSIHAGNMSFTNDYYSFRMRELGEFGEASTSGQSGGKVGETRSRELGVAEAKTNGVVRESEDQNYEKSMDERCLSHRSDRSNMSTQSFAFPILAGDVQNGASMRMGPKRQQSKPEPCAKPEPGHLACTEPKSSVAAGNAGASYLCSCFPCRSFF